MQSAQLLRSVRIRSGLTQAEVARRAGTSQPVVSAYEHGRRDPSTATLERLVAAAGGRLHLRATEAPADPPPMDDVERGRRLVDVLLLADALPIRPKVGYTAPRMDSGSAGR